MEIIIHSIERFVKKENIEFPKKVETKDK